MTVVLLLWNVSVLVRGGRLRTITVAGTGLERRGDVVPSTTLLAKDLHVGEDPMRTELEVTAIPSRASLLSVTAIVR